MSEEIELPVKSYYAQINNESVAIGVSQLKGRVNSPNMILLDEYDTSIVGSVYDADSGTFTHIPAEPTPQRKIPKFFFLNRLDATERIAIRNSNDDNVLDFMYLLDSVAGDVDLDLTVDGINYIDSIGLLTVSSVSDILADAQPHELN